MTSKLFSNTSIKTIEKKLKDFFQSNASISLTPLKGGANNRIFLLKHQNNQFILKNYFQNESENRSRLTSEYQFLEYAWGLGIRNIPKPLIQLKSENIALISHIDGKTPSQDEIEIEGALNFLLKLNKKPTKIHSLMPAAESCFCYQDYLDTVERKFSRLNKANSPSLSDFLENLFLPSWKTLKANFLSKHKSELKIRFPADEFCITPSDFGFHNAIIKNKETYFIDFEYAGTDDVVKTICDFFCQPKYPVPLKHLTRFVSGLLKLTNDPIHCIRRIQDLMPICQMKWCCIILNIFLKDGKQRREFSSSDQEETLQLKKAISYFNHIKEEFAWPI